VINLPAILATLPPDLPAPSLADLVFVRIRGPWSLPVAFRVGM